MEVQSWGSEARLQDVEMVQRDSSAAVEEQRDEG